MYLSLFSTLEHPSKVPRQVRTVSLDELVIPLLNCSNIQNDNLSKHLVDIPRVIEDSRIIIEQQLEEEPNEAGAFRRDPLVFSRLARGGKTTVLTTLFDALQKNGYLVMIISFNGASGFIRQGQESAEEAIMRQIVRQLINQTNADELLHLQCSEQVFDKFLDQQTRYGSSLPVPFILLIDELNVLGAPLLPSASKFLQRLFLRKNRYLVFSTHIPLNLSTEELTDKNSMMSLSSSTDIKVVRMPQSNDLSELRKMEGCTALTGHEATIYGGIPALIYSASKNVNFPCEKFSQTVKRFCEAFPKMTTNTKLQVAILKQFLYELMDGGRSNGAVQLRFFDQFSSIPEPGKICWPLCYLSEILKFLKVSGSGIIEVIEEIYKISRHIPVFASVVDIGLDWQSVVDVAVLLRALEALLWKGKHPLVPSLTEVKSIEFVPMPDEYRTLTQAEEFINNLPTRESGHLYTIRSTFARFPLFDGFLVAVLPDNVKNVIGYQVKLGRHTPRYSVPRWVDGGGFLIRGLASTSSRRSSKGWKHMSDNEIQNFIGYSLAPLYPASWLSEVSTKDRFD